MALKNNFSQAYLYEGDDTPEWKRLGYSSQQEYVNAMTGASGNKKAPITLQEAYGTNSPLQTSVRDRLNALNGDIVQKFYGVTDEGVVTGNPTLEKFPTIKNNSSGKTSSDTLSSMKETSVAATGGGSVPAASVPTGGSTEELVETGGNEFGAKYQGNDFLEWYNANYGADYDPSQGFSRGQGMSDVDWAIGNNLYGTYLTGQTLNKNYNLGKETTEQNYGQSIEALNTSKRNSQQAASITLDKLKKYLPTQIKAQGLGGLGVSESSILQAYTDYNNRMGDIESDYNATKSTLEANRNATLADLESNYLREIGDLQTGALESTQNIFDKYLTDYRTEQSELYNQALYALESSGYSTVEELTSFLNQYRGVLSNENLQTLEQTAKGIVAQNAEQKRLGAEQKAESDRLAAKENVMDYWALMQTDPANYRIDSNGNQIITEEARNRMQQYLDANRAALGDIEYNSLKSQLDNMTVYTEADRQKEEAEAQAEEDKRIITGQKLVEYDGKYYQIMSRLDRDANEITRNNDFKEQIKAMGYSGAYDKKIPNGTTLVVKSDAYGKNEFNLIDDWLGGANITDWRNWIPGYNLYNYANRWFNFETRTLTYYNGEWYSSIEAKGG